MCCRSPPAAITVEQARESLRLLSQLEMQWGEATRFISSLLVLVALQVLWSIEGPATECPVLGCVCLLAFCDPTDCTPPGSAFYGSVLARTLEWVAISSSRGSSRPRGWTWVSCVSCSGRRMLCRWATREAPGASSCASVSRLQNHDSLLFTYEFCSCSSKLALSYTKLLLFQKKKK